jgi:U-box domain
MNSSFHTIDSTNSLPSEFVCPITLAVMKNPMRDTETGHCFEREAVMNWMYMGNTKCPLTRKALHPDNFVLDEQLQRKIQKWKAADQECHDSTLDEDTGMDDSAASFDDFDDFDETLNNIVEITDRIRTLAVNQNRQRQSVPSTVTITTPISGVEAGEESQPGQSMGRLSDIRMRVLQKREDRIKNIMSNIEDLAPKYSDGPDLSLAGLMMSQF